MFLTRLKTGLLEIFCFKHKMVISFMHTKMRLNLVLTNSKLLFFIL